jgi:LysR family transcriptional regulator (chromosome initiation inhibitor)
VELKGPVHWVPTTMGFLDMTLVGLAWGLHPRSLVRPHLDAGRLVELAPGIEIKLYWTVARLHASSLQALTEAVLAAAKSGLSA